MRSLLCILCLCIPVWAISDYDLEKLLSKANIYYQKVYTESKPHELVLGDVTELKNTTNIKLIIHGYLGSRTTVAIRPLVNAYLAQGNSNILVADWKEAAHLDYRSSRSAVTLAGLAFARILENFMNKFDIEAEEIHILGHSLGAHIAGRIGRYFNGTLGRVTGLDPALPLFTFFSEDGLRKDAAQFVDVIHTDFPVFGDITPRGVVDFYPNFGVAPQPGCENSDIVSVSRLVLEAYSCSHNRAVILYAETIGLPENFPSISCNFNSIKLHDLIFCNTKMQLYMGENVDKNAHGYYYLETYDTAPYGMGKNSKFLPKSL